MQIVKGYSISHKEFGCYQQTLESLPVFSSVANQLIPQTQEE